MQADYSTTAAHVRSATGLRPRVAVICGSGLGSLADGLADAVSLPYASVPHFPVSTVEGHAGNLLLGRLEGVEVLMMQGRFHYYEGYSMGEVTLPVRVMRELGIETLIVSNAAGGVNPEFGVGDLMLIADHINLFPEHPLRGKNVPYGPRFPDMSAAYDPALRRLCQDVAHVRGVTLREGVYLGVQGPTYETPAEYRMYRRLGADAVGMSTVPEVIVARHCGIRVLGFSVITNVWREGSSAPVSHAEVQAAADSARQSLTAIIREVIQRL